MNFCAGSRRDGSRVQTISGPVGIARQTGLAVQQPELQPIIGLTAVISINLGIVNLLPFPILDGGTIFLLLIEGMLRRDLNQDFKERIYQAAFVVIILLFVFIMFNDISKLPVFEQAAPLVSRDLKFAEQFDESTRTPKSPQGLKPHDFIAFMARLKSRPDTKQSSLLERTNDSGH